MRTRLQTSQADATCVYVVRLSGGCWPPENRGAADDSDWIQVCPNTDNPPGFAPSGRILFLTRDFPMTHRRRGFRNLHNRQVPLSGHPVGTSWRLLAGPPANTQPPCHVPDPRSVGDGPVRVCAPPDFLRCYLTGGYRSGSRLHTSGKDTATPFRGSPRMPAAGLGPRSASQPTPDARRLAVLIMSIAASRLSCRLISRLFVRGGSSRLPRGPPDECGTPAFPVPCA
jgi:hypothetical protein